MVSRIGSTFPHPVNSRETNFKSVDLRLLNHSLFRRCKSNIPKKKSQTHRESNPRSLHPKGNSLIIRPQGRATAHTHVHIYLYVYVRHFLSDPPRSLSFFPVCKFCVCSCNLSRSMRQKGLVCDPRAVAGVLTSLTRCKSWAGAAVLADEMALTGIVHNAYRCGDCVFARAVGVEDRVPGAMWLLCYLL